MPDTEECAEVPGGEVGVDLDDLVEAGQCFVDAVLSAQLIRPLYGVLRSYRLQALAARPVWS